MLPVSPVYAYPSFRVRLRCVFERARVTVVWVMRGVRLNDVVGLLDESYKLRPRTWTLILSMRGILYMVH